MADCHYNAEQIFTMMREADQQGVRVLCLPELCPHRLYLRRPVLQDTLLCGAEEGLNTILEATRNLDLVAAVGLPVRDRVGRQAVQLRRPDPAGVRSWAWSPRSTCPTMGSFTRSAGSPPGRMWTIRSPCAARMYACPTARSGPVRRSPIWSSGWRSARTCGRRSPLRSPGPVGRHPDPEPVRLQRDGGQANYRRNLVAGQSGRLLCGYVYADAGEGSPPPTWCSADTISSRRTAPCWPSGALPRGSPSARSTYSAWPMSAAATPPSPPARDPMAEAHCLGVGRVSFHLKVGRQKLTRYVSPTLRPRRRGGPGGAVQRDPEDRRPGPEKRLEHTRARTAVVGLSGGLDSTLAILITAVAMKLLDRPESDIIAVTMPCFGTTDRTRDNAVELAQRLGATLKRIDIGEAVKVHFRDIGQSMEDHSVTFENGQARERTQVLMDIANQTGGMVIGTGDLSELALGWATYNGDHMSMYAVNA